MSYLISKKGDYALFQPHNEWDMNYHLVNLVDGSDHLIDIEEVYDFEEEGEDGVGISFDYLASLDDIDVILEYSWRTIKGE